MKTKEVVVEFAVKPDDTPEGRYKAMVIAAASGNAPTEAELVNVVGDAVRLFDDFESDLARLEKRLDAAETLLVKVPELERLATEAKAKAAAVKNLGDRPLSDFATVGQLGDALRAVFAQGERGYVSSESIAVVQAEHTARSVKADAIRVLHSTADRSIDGEIQSVQSAIEDTRRAIAGRAAMVDLEGRIEQQTVFCGKLSDGNATWLEAYQKTKQDFRPAGAIYKEARQRLRDLVAMRPAAKQAEAQNRDDERKIVAARERVAELHASKLIPERMVWSE